MTWNKNHNPKSAGWYLCTVQDGNCRYVMPLQCCEYPKGNFYWSGLNHGEIIACVKFPKPYGGDINDDKYEQLYFDI